ncbi:carbon starvation protein A [Thermoanaerobacterium sp. DL9XJH110]|uniref:carbon starvation CstA family protein n=1 Tax=Thermoanaerobacterium sp. DL9XJH110 TaxID=3386643 RepID=UPI003BB528A1
MVTFTGSIIALIVGYAVYGKFVEKVFGADEKRKTPCYTVADGVDYVPMGKYRNSLIQLLNIAGLGPIYGAISGALWGPAAFLWIVFGGIFAGAVHDYLTGMISIRNNGANVPELAAKYLGEKTRVFVNAFAVLLLVLVGVVFVTGPAGLLAILTPEVLTKNVWVWIIFAYYFLATLLPIDKLIGRIYPFFGAILLIMAAGIGGSLIIQGYKIPELTLANLHPRGAPLWPLLFITIACGAISGFHATQSPIVARCVRNEKEGRFIFYGMMIAESVIALIWAAAAISFYGGTAGLGKALSTPAGPSAVVKDASFAMMGTFGGVLAILGVVVLPITSGDTAFRAARYTIAEMLKLNQQPMLNRYKIAIPLFAVGAILSQMNFNILWRYFAWSNQTLAMLMLWTGAVYLVREKRLHWVATIPAAFMTAVSVTYILQAPEGFGLPTAISYPVGVMAAVAALVYFYLKTRKSAPGLGLAEEKI